MNLFNEAMKYARQGLSVIPVHGKKALGGWKQYQVRRVTKPMLVRLFKQYGPKVTGLALLTGRGSRHWVVRDFDKAGAYDAWAAEHPDLAAILPTVKTGRGHHVYFRCFGSIPTVKLGDGELRAEGTYTLLPPSRHPSGGQYQWLKPLWSCHYVFHPHETGLNKFGLSSPDVTQEVLGGVGEGLNEGLSEEGLGQGSEDGLELDKFQEIQFINRNEVMTVEKAVELAIPEGSSRNHASLFTLQRCLLTMKVQGRLGKVAFKRLQDEAFENWLENNRFLNPVNAPEDYYAEFVECGGHVRIPYGAGTLSLAWGRASTAEPDEAALSFVQASKQRLSLLCRELQRLQPDRPFFLSARNAAELVGVTPMTVSRWLGELRAKGVIRLERRGGVEDKQASEYRYMREMPLADAPPALVDAPEAPQDPIQP